MNEVSFTENTQLRGHSLKLNKHRANKSIRVHSFALRNIPVGYDLLAKRVNSKTVVEFKTKLEKLCLARRYDITDIY